MPVLRGQGCCRTINCTWNAKQPRTLRRILVVGNSGAGKSRLSRALAERLGLPIVHLDRHYWRPGWVEPAQEEWRDQVEQLVAADGWVLDGNYGSTFDLRLPRADLVVWMDPHPLICEYQALRRWWVGRRSQARVDLPEGCEEAVDRQFLLYIWTYRRKAAPKFHRALAQYAPELPVVRLTTRRAARRWLAAPAARADPGVHRCRRASHT